MDASMIKKMEKKKNLQMEKNARWLRHNVSDLHFVCGSYFTLKSNADPSSADLN
jgi:hypothetical protein